MPIARPVLHRAAGLVRGAAFLAASLALVAATFAPRTAGAQTTWTITATADANSSISPSGAVVVNDGTDQAFTISALTGYHVADVLVDGSSVGPVSAYTFTGVTSDHTIAVSSAIDSFTVTASAGTNGSISPDGVTTLAYGGSQAYTITPAANYHVADVLVDGVSVGAVTSYTFTGIAASHTIAASFAIDQNTITASAGANGSISPSGAVAVDYGASQAFTITPDAGYSVLDVLVDGVTVGPVTSYTFTNVTAAHTIAASFTVTLPPATINADSPSGTLSSTTSSLTVPVTISRTYSNSNRLFHVVLQLGGGLTLTGGTAGITEGTYLSSGGGTTDFHVVDNGGGSYTVDGTILGSPCNNTALTGTLFNVAVSSSAPSGPGTVTLTTTSLRDCNNDPLPSTIGTAASVNIDNTPPAVTVTAPNGGETWVVGTSHAVTWTASDNAGVASVDLAYSTDGGATYPNAIATGLANTGSYAWTIPATLSTQVRVRATAHDTAGNTASDASDADFTIAQWVLTATAGANGSISPSGAVGVNDGGSQAFTITPSAHYHVAVVLVDGASVGAVTSYTFSSVTANHTIAASFAIDTYTITASAGANGSVSPAGVTSVGYGDTLVVTVTPVAGYHVADVLVDSVSVGAVTSYTFAGVAANHTISASFAINAYTITASAGPNGTITPSGAVPVTFGASQSFTIAAAATYHVDDVLVDGVSVGRVTSYTFTGIAASHTIAASFAANPPVPAITALVSTQVKSGNDADGTTKIAVTWPAVAAGSTVQVYRAPYGNYPEYDDPPTPGAVPALPSYPPSAPWSLTAITASGQTDEMTTRDCWYFVAFVTDSFGTVSPVSNLAGGTLNYHLGDVTDGTTPGQGNNVVDIADISLLGAHYGITGTAVAAYAYLDVGPTTNRTVDGRPMTDDQIDFEDLVMFAINYMVVSSPQASAKPVAAAASDEVLLEVPAEFTDAGRLTAQLTLRGTGAIQGLSAKLSWNPAVVRLVSDAPGELADALGAVVMSAHPGVIDMARLGVRDAGLAGEGTVANVTFERVGPGDPKIALESVDARSAANAKLAVAFRSVTAPEVPAVTSFSRIAPNPFRAGGTLAFGLARSGPVELAVFSVDGRLVRRLVGGTRDAGMYQVAWDGRDEAGSPVAAGVYYARLVTGQGRFTRSLVYLR